jgi:uncharacterized repeat protein (TIGR04076 family)
MRLKIKVVEIKGHCPVYRKGDKFYVKDGYKLDTKITLCMHSLLSIMPYYVAFSHDISPQKLGLSKKGRKDSLSAYVQCLDPCRYTHGGTVIFEITREK